MANYTIYDDYLVKSPIAPEIVNFRHDNILEMLENKKLCLSEKIQDKHIQLLSQKFHFEKRNQLIFYDTNDDDDNGFGMGEYDDFDMDEYNEDDDIVQ